MYITVFQFAIRFKYTCYVVVLLQVCSILLACLTLVDLFKGIEERSRGISVPPVNFVSSLILVLTLVGYKTFTHLASIIPSDMISMLSSAVLDAHFTSTILDKYC